MARDATWEQSWRDHLARKVTALYGVSTTVLERLVVERLAEARERHGDDGYLLRDILAVAIDKTTDAVACVLLEAEKQVAGGHAPSLPDLERAAIHLAMADHYLRSAKRQRSIPT